ncbi:MULTISPECIES: aldose epimerase family protein [unclassified Leeuwenhoekiella]|uniref:aldose epimerase family protein n=1 Tax=unclassified Leeuwenhoekiella TaxID=2615029 RepID=UPI000C460E6C|nr:MULTISPECIES: aldose epimerase family protein [unclassified Leeuwenhoekiella]MAW94864.1 galactose-1-epimerase [Leeuwenhoekiella sp.]MBA79584.1 galactose-1-epimerase [Leeuwenhoekiella sp.]
MNVIKKLMVVPVVLGMAFTAVNCKNETKKDETAVVEEMPQASITKSDFGMFQDSIPVEKYALVNANGMEVDVITYGGIITSLKAPSQDSTFQDVVLGFDSLDQYVEGSPYFGAIIGRYGNRIAKGEFKLDGETYKLPANDGENSLHGGTAGFDKVVWNAEEVKDGDNVGLKLTYLSPDGDMGYPGNLETTVTYTLQADNTLMVKYEATTDKPTVVNLTQHSYFNLSGDFDKTILDTEIMINADQYLPVDAGLIPTGELKSVAGTPFDFNKPKKIGAEINEENDQLKKGLGYDHCWILNGTGGEMKLAATALDPESGRFMEIMTTEPAIQFYTGNFLDGTLTQKGGEGTYAYRSGFCLETQHYPDSPNQADFPSTVLKPGEKYETTTSFKFSVRE